LALCDQLLKIGEEMDSTFREFTEDLIGAVKKNFKNEKDFAGKSLFEIQIKFTNKELNLKHQTLI